MKILKIIFDKNLHYKNLHDNTFVIAWKQEYIFLKYHWNLNIFEILKDATSE